MKGESCLGCPYCKVYDVGKGVKTAWCRDRKMSIPARIHLNGGVPEKCSYILPLPEIRQEGDGWLVKVGKLEYPFDTVKDMYAGLALMEYLQVTRKGVLLEIMENLVLV